MSTHPSTDRPSHGGCLCGAVRFEARGVSTGIHACHCSMCRRWSGGPGMGVDVAAVTFADDAHLGRFRSSPWAERGFCTRCGTSLFYRLEAADRYTLWLGAFDDQTPFELAGEIYVDEKPSSYALAGDHPRMTGEEFLASLGPAASE